MINDVLRVIKERRSVYRYVSKPVTDEELQTILEAGSWAPSWSNTQPWRFIVVKDNAVRRAICDVIREVTIVHTGVEEAPVIVVVCVNPEEDPYHYVEDGAAATQNMALAASSLGLSTYWVGVFDAKDGSNSSEKRIKKILNVPKNCRIIAVLPVGTSAYTPQKTRKRVHELIGFDSYGSLLGSGVKSSATY